MKKWIIERHLKSNQQRKTTLSAGPSAEQNRDANSRRKVREGFNKAKALIPDPMRRSSGGARAQAKRKASKIHMVEMTDYQADAHQREIDAQEASEDSDWDEEEDEEASQHEERPGGYPLKWYNVMGTSKDEKPRLTTMGVGRMRSWIAFYENQLGWRLYPEKIDQTCSGCGCRHSHKDQTGVKKYRL